jgi:hypothetical protein
MGDMTHIEHPIQLVETHGEPTVRDVDLERFRIIRDRIL